MGGEGFYVLESVSVFENFLAVGAMDWITNIARAKGVLMRTRGRAVSGGKHACPWCCGRLMLLR